MRKFACSSFVPARARTTHRLLVSLFSFHFKSARVLVTERQCLSAPMSHNNFSSLPMAAPPEARTVTVSYDADSEKFEVSAAC